MRTFTSTLFTRRCGRITLAAAAIVAALFVQAVAQTGSRWLLVVPPLVADKSALIKVYSSNSVAEVRAAVDSLPEDEQILMVTKVYSILTIPSVIARTEALLDALRDTSAPVPKWRPIGAFDSAASCERERQLALQTFERKVLRVRYGYPESEELSSEDWRLFEGLAACRSSRCVPESSFLAR
ncbi:MAG TPA: hypothetical protein VLB49_07690 [Gemmatimonadales bacterium]|nr:hypothetical protein [Gemmatimonadales bacterium]